MFQTGSQINPSLGRTDYSAYAQGAIAGGQAIGQGIANLGQGIASGIEQYAKQKKENKIMEGKLKASISSLEGFRPIADNVSPEASKQLTKTLSELNSPDIPLTERLARAEAATGTLTQLINFGIKEKEKSDAVTATNLALASAQSGKPVPLIYKPEILASAGSQALDFAAKRSSLDSAILNQAQTAAEVDKIKEQTAAIKRGDPVSLGGYKTAEEAQVVSDTLARLAGDNFLPRVEQNPKDRSYTAGTVLKPQPVVPDKYRDMAAQARFENDKATVDSAQNAINEIQTNNNIISLLDSGQVSTGISSAAQQIVDKSLSFFGNEDAAKRASETEILDSLLGRSFLDERARAKITSTMMNTKAELELYRGIFSGTKTLEPESIKKIAQLKAKIAEGVIDSHNRRIKDGSLDQYYNSIFGRNGTVIKIPEYVKPPTASDKPTRIPTASQLTQTPQVTPAPQAPQAPSFAVTTIGGRQLPMITKRAIRLQPQAASLPNSPLMKTYNESAPASEFSIDNLTRKFSLNR